MSTRQEHVAQVTALAHRFVDIAAEQETHRVVLEALLSAYASVAISHPCCTRNAAVTARRTADLIETHAVPAGAPHNH